MGPEQALRARVCSERALACGFWISWRLQTDGPGPDKGSKAVLPPRQVGASRRRLSVARNQGAESSTSNCKVSKHVRSHHCYLFRNNELL